MQKNAAKVAYPAIMCALLIISTLWIKFSIPGTSILFTTQVFFVLLCGQLFPPVTCVYSIGSYLFLGLIGLPVFSATQGLAVVMTPSFGYLLSFPFAAIASSWCARRLRERKHGRYIASFAGILVIYAIALPYVALLRTFYVGAPIPLAELLTAYCLMFLPMDFLKGFFAAWLAPRLHKALRLYA